MNILYSNFACYALFLFPIHTRAPPPPTHPTYDDIRMGYTYKLQHRMGWQLHGQHGHSHGSILSQHSHENINVRAAFIHVLGDVLQSIGVFCAALVIYFRPSWQLADPICTFIFSIIVLFTTLNILKDAVVVSGKSKIKHYIGG